MARRLPFDKLVYIAGPYRGQSEWDVLQNVRRAEELALRVWRLGAACICPHKNTASFGGAADDSVWLLGDMEMLRRCDAVMCTDNWSESSGARAEVNLARRLGIPVFERLEHLERWLSNSSPPLAVNSLKQAFLGLTDWMEDLWDGIGEAAAVG